MGIAESGVYGPMIGKVGQVVWYKLKGQTVARGVGDRIAPKTANEIKAGKKHRELIEFFKRTQEFIRRGFTGAAMDTKYNYHNLAMSYNRANAMNPSNEVAEILYQKMLLSQGNLLVPQNPSVAVVGSSLQFSWEYPSDSGFEYRNNRVMLLVYFPDEHNSHTELSGAKRAELTDSLNLHPTELTKTMHVYMAFGAHDSLDVSDSVYVGQIN